MLTFIAQDLGDCWTADSNGTDVKIAFDGYSAKIVFGAYRPNDNKKRTIKQGLFGWRSVSIPGFDRTSGTLTFTDCCRWRWDPTNDEEWFKRDAGDGRYSTKAPEWGLFYELVGDDPDRDAVAWNILRPDDARSRHFLYYFRDETLEFMASGWSFSTGPVT